MTITTDMLSGADWFKSSHSNDHGGACVEGAHLPGGAMAVRDSKNPHGPAFISTSSAWAAFVNALANGEF
ncbi:DUF397 domain-containing protein [Streptomyces sp. NPDC050428]|uniref:DUF397 domain-containing protein n=1 Tax=Streptomyces sp. NPDC050428 TaxID=3155757 RepID=UPI0034236429